MGVTPTIPNEPQKFKEASARYNRLIQNTDTKAAYEQILAGAGPGAQLRTMVIGDILTAPDPYAGCAP